MLRLIYFLTFALPVVFGFDFDRELQCRNDFNNINDGILIFAFIIVIGLLAFVQLIAVSVAVWYIKKKLCSQIDEVVEKTHTVMDAVLVSLLPQNVTIELAVPAENKKKDGSKKDKKSAE